MRRIGIVPNLDKEQAERMARDLIVWLGDRGFRPALPVAVAVAMGRADLGVEFTAWGRQVDAAIVLGGDGTLLGAARTLAGQDVPLVGVNLGHLGFLTEVEDEDLYDSLASFLRGEGCLDERSLMHAELHRGGQVIRSYLALNDVVISKGPFARLVQVEALINGTSVMSYNADGIIVATPTGSTAYSLSAGGPVMGPDLEAMVVTPICPHTFSSRPMVVRQTDEILIRVHGGDRHTVLTVDGQKGQRVFTGDEVLVRDSGVRAKLWRREPWDFYRRLREKLGAHQV